jgi:hypothetical protein
LKEFQCFYMFSIVALCLALEVGIEDFKKC